MSADNVVLIVRDGDKYKAYDCSDSDVTCQPWWSYTDHNGELLRRKGATRGARLYCQKFGRYIEGCDNDTPEGCERKALNWYRKWDEVLEYGTEIFY